MLHLAGSLSGEMLEVGTPVGGCGRSLQKFGDDWLWAAKGRKRKEYQMIPECLPRVIENDWPPVRLSEEFCLSNVLLAFPLKFFLLFLPCLAPEKSDSIYSLLFSSVAFPPRALKPHQLRRDPSLKRNHKSAKQHGALVSFSLPLFCKF